MTTPALLVRADESIERGEVPTVPHAGSPVLVAGESRFGAHRFSPIVVFDSALLWKIYDKRVWPKFRADRTSLFVSRAVLYGADLRL